MELSQLNILNMLQLELAMLRFSSKNMKIRSDVGTRKPVSSQPHQQICSTMLKTAGSRIWHHMLVFLIWTETRVLKLSNWSIQLTVVINLTSYQAPVDNILSAANSPEWYCQSVGLCSSPAVSYHKSQTCFLECFYSGYWTPINVVVEAGLTNISECLLAGLPSMLDSIIMFLCGLPEKNPFPHICVWRAAAACIFIYELCEFPCREGSHLLLLWLDHMLNEKCDMKVLFDYHFRCIWIRAELSIYSRETRNACVASMLLHISCLTICLLCTVMSKNKPMRDQVSSATMLVL